MPEWIISIISVIVGAIISAIFTGKYAWKNIKKTIELQNKLRNINRFKDSLVDIVAKIDAIDTTRTQRLIDILKSCYVECGVAIERVDSYLSCSQKGDVKDKYKKYKEKCKSYSIDITIIKTKKIHKDSVKSILDVIN
jgi:hypothetical protein